jgi:radical SAM enzyme (TIGR01210 family)
MVTRHRPDDDQIFQHLLRANQSAGKDYAFNDAHDDTRPLSYWFQESDEGLILFVVYYTLACRWSACLGCNLPSVSAQRPVSYASLVKQIDAVFSAPEVLDKRSRIAKLIVSNNGSVLDELTFPTTALLHLLVQINLHLPGLHTISMESRPEYVDVEELEVLLRAMTERSPPAEVEIAVGLEAFDEQVRNTVFHKGFSLETFERLVERMRKPGFRLKCYFMHKPVPGMSDAEAIEDVRNGIEYLHQLGVTSGVRINLHLNPTYAARGTELERSFLRGEYAPPHLVDVARAVLHARGKAISLFVGLNDEGLAVPGGSFLRPGDEPLVAALEAFNRSQDHATLEAWCRAHGIAPSGG